MQNLKINNTEIQGLYVINLDPIKDNRGFFVRSFCKKEFYEIKKDISFVQLNHSYSNHQGTIRGMHYQIPPFSEIKLIRCIKGSVLDVVVDLRKGSKTFLKWHSELLTESNMTMIYVPEGFAHGFQTLEDNCEMLYLHTEFYNKNYECGLRFDDPKINIPFNTNKYIISDKDKSYKFIDDNFQGVEL